MRDKRARRTHQMGTKSTERQKSLGPGARGELSYRSKGMADPVRSALYAVV